MMKKLLTLLFAVAWASSPTTLCKILNVKAK
jgi:hypothetical protein